MPARRRGMTQDDVRKLALELPEVIAGAHMGHADFRLGGRIFASLPSTPRGRPELGPLAMVRVAPAAQKRLIESDADAFYPAGGAWGRQGCTLVRLERVSRRALQAALRSAWGEAVAAGSPAPGSRSRRATPKAAPHSHR